MSTEITANSLTTFEVAQDGTRFRLNLRDDLGKTVSISLPSECLNQLVMTMPCIATEALRRQYRNAALRLVYPVSGWELETTETEDNLILTLATPDGFKITFAIPIPDVSRIAASMDRFLLASKGAAAALN